MTSGQATSIFILLSSRMTRYPVKSSRWFKAKVTSTEVAAAQRQVIFQTRLLSRMSPTLSTKNTPARIDAQPFSGSLCKISSSSSQRPKQYTCRSLVHAKKPSVTTAHLRSMTAASSCAACVDDLTSNDALTLVHRLPGGSFLLLFGKVADLFGRRNVLITSLYFFSFLSLGTGCSPHAIALDVFEWSHGLGIFINNPSCPRNSK